MKKPWRTPRPVAHDYVDWEDAALKTALVSLCAMIPGALLGALVGWITGVLGGQFLAAELAMAGMGVGLLLPPAVLGVKALRHWRASRRPKLGAFWRERVTEVDARLEALGARAEENPTLVKDVGRRVLAARARVVAGVLELNEVTDSGLASPEQGQEARNVLSAELTRINDVLINAMAALDEARALSGVGVTRLNALVGQFEDTDLGDLGVELKVRREVMKDLLTTD